MDFYSSIDDEWELGSTGDGGDAEGEEGTFSSGYSADHVLILLDCGAAMWDPVFPDPEFPDDSLSSFDFVVQRITSFLKTEIRQRATWKTGKRNGFGLYLFNTRNVPDVEWDSPLQRQTMGGGETTAGDKKHTTTKGDEYNADEDEEDEYGGGTSFGQNRSATTTHQLIPLEPPAIATIQTLKAIQDDGILDPEFDVQEAYGGGNENKQDDEEDETTDTLQAALMVAGTIINDAKCVHKKTKEDRLPDRVRIFIITNTDKVSEYAASTAKDLVDRKFEIGLFPLPRADKDIFDYQRGYASMPFVQNFSIEEDGSSSLSKSTLLDWWQNEALRDGLDVWKAVRPIHCLPMLWPGEQDTTEETAYLQLNWFRLVQTARRPMKIVVHQETGVQLNSMVQIVEADSISQEILYEKVTGDKDNPPKISPRLCSYVDIQGTRVPMSEEDKIALKSNSHPHKFASFRVIGFRPAGSIDRTTCSMEPAYFCIPPDDNDSRVKGSGPAFSALHATMMSKKALLLGEVLTRKTATTRLVAGWALSELMEKDGDEEFMLRPPGLLMIVLPFDNEIKNPISDVTTRAEEPLAIEALVEEAKAIVDGITVTPKLGVHFPNTPLDLFWDTLEEVALNERNAAVKDETMMTQEDVLKRVGSHLQKFMELLPEDPVPVKKRKERELVPDDSGIDWLDEYCEGRLVSHKIPDLKKFLKSVGATVSGSKTDLIERMKPYLEKKLASST